MHAILSSLQPTPQPFWLGPDDARSGVLLVHGFTGTPFEMRLVGEALAARGLQVLAPLLAGHAGTTEDLRKTGWTDWLASVERGFDTLRARCERVAVCGLSLGGLLTLELARRRGAQVAAIAVLSTALRLPERAIKWEARLQRLPFADKIAFPKLAGSDLSDPVMRRLNQIAQGRAAMPVTALHSLIEFGAHVEAHLGEVTQPALVMHAKQDHTIPFTCHPRLVRGLGSRTVSELVLERSFHVITLDVERDRVSNAVAEHVLHYLQAT